MPRIAFAVVTLLVCACLGSAQESDPHAPKQHVSDADDKESKPNKEAKPSKAELAQAALAKAEERHKDALKQATDAMDELEDFITKFDKGHDPTKIAEDIQGQTEKAMESDEKDADEVFHKHLANLRNAEAGTSLDGLEAQARKAARDIQQQSRRKEREMRKALEHMSKGKQAEAKGLRREAKKAARASLKAARELEKAQRHAGVKEHIFEGEMDHNEHVSEGMEDRVGDLGDRAADHIERVFGKVEDILDGSSDRIGFAADRRAESDRQAVKDARSHAEAVAATDRAARAKAAAKSHQDNSKSAGNTTHAADSTPAEAATGTSAIGLAIAPGSDLSGVEVVGLCCLFALSALLALRLAAARSHEGIREAPLLG